MLYIYVGNAGFDSWQGQEISLFSKMPRLSLGPTQPPIQQVPRIFSPLEAQWLGHEDDYTPPFSVMVKNEWSYTSAPPVHIHAVDWANYTFL